VEQAPLAVALWRANEARPILDVGCGFGEFGSIFFKDATQRPEVGLDIHRGELLRCRANNPYQHILQADGRRMPFPDASFASVMSISVMEHIPGVEDVLKEIGRVLRPGGVLAYAVPIDAFGRNLIGSRVLGLVSKDLAASYGARVTRLMEIENDWPMQRWRDMTENAGLVIDECRAILSPAATMATEALLPAAYASRLYRKAFGRRPPRPAPLVPILESMIKPWVEDDSPGGSNILVVARKPA